MLDVSSLNKTYPDGRPVLADISFRVEKGQAMTIIGPSGCGKTTLLYLLCGLLRPDSGGSVLLDGEPVSRPRPDIAIILQDYGLLPWRTVEDNVALGLKIQGVGSSTRKARARELLGQVGLAGRESDYPARLSGGEQQRVAIARAYAARPKLLLMDEPFSSLDAITRESLQRTLLDMWRETGVAYAMVTHSVEEAVYLGGAVHLMSGRPASIRQVVANPGFGSPNYRESDAYFSVVRQVRDAMRTHWTHCSQDEPENLCSPE